MAVPSCECDRFVRLLDSYLWLFRSAGSHWFKITFFEPQFRNLLNPTEDQALCMPRETRLRQGLFDLLLKIFDYLPRKITVYDNRVCKIERASLNSPLQSRRREGGVHSSDSAGRKWSRAIEENHREGYEGTVGGGLGQGYGR